MRHSVCEFALFSQITIDGLARVMCMSEYLPDKSPKPDTDSNRKQSAPTACPRSATVGGRSTASTVDGGSSHCSARPRRQSAFPNSTRPPPTAAANRHQRRQHSIACPPRRATMSAEETPTSAGLSSCRSSSRQFMQATSSPSGIRHSRTEPIADQVALLTVFTNHVGQFPDRYVLKPVGTENVALLPVTTKPVGSLVPVIDSRIKLPSGRATSGYCRPSRPTSGRQ